MQEEGHVLYNSTGFYIKQLNIFGKIYVRKCSKKDGNNV